MAIYLSQDERKQLENALLKAVAAYRNEAEAMEKLLTSGNKFISVEKCEQARDEYMNRWNKTLDLYNKVVDQPLIKIG